MWPYFPPEILAEILCYVKNDGIEITNPSTYPTHLRLVCKFWQTILLSTPEIWSHIHINLDRIYPPSTSGRRIDEHRQGIIHNKLPSALQTCLDRSMSLPLTIHLRSRCFSGGDRQRELLGSILTVCMRHSERWLDISFDFEIGGLVSILPLGQAYPRLRTLRLRSAPNDTGLFPFPPQQAGPFSNAQSLNELHLRLFSQRLLPQLHIPWSQITHFSVSMFECIFTEGLRCATLMPNLVSWTLRELGLDILATEYFDSYVAYLSADSSPPAFTPSTSASIEQPPPPLITLPALKTLRLSSYNSIPDSPLLFTKLQTPHLSTLEIHFNRPPHSWNWNWINAFEKYITHSQCTITSLSLKNLSAVGVLVFLILLSRVEELVLEEVGFTKELLGMLTYPGGELLRGSLDSPLDQSYVGRRIRKMVIDKPKFGDLEHGPEMLVSMIRSRLPVTPMTQSRRDAGSGTGRDWMEWVELSSLRVVTGRASGSPNTGAGGGSRSTPDLHRLLEQSVVGYDFESAGVNLVFEEELSDGVGNEAGVWHKVCFAISPR